LSALCVDDNTCGLVRAQTIRVEHEVVVRRALTIDLVETPEVVGTSLVSGPDCRSASDTSIPLSWATRGALAAADAVTNTRKRSSRAPSAKEAACAPITT
jgi:hypothetical protein